MMNNTIPNKYKVSKWVYRYRLIFDELYSATPFGEWQYCDKEKYNIIREAVNTGKGKYQVQRFEMIEESINY